ncbi:MAG: hypothetical protein HYW02_00550 [Deltaproteobacteria bacterium]|nr:hypothetical protein [Deltaproteobacteria bacterium]MBI2499975.1 hypothetical protein [Deltaproteobacteria bacterium]MBI4196581.1 hypothetical protein [Deltaproteobacteria bacterium]
MTQKERWLRDLCIEIAIGNIGGDRFNDLLMKTGILLDEREWDTANKILGQSEILMNLVDTPPPPC